MEKEERPWQEEKRPWREEKRSWILYFDRLKKFDNIISDIVDGNIYIFDCETARLSIWAEEWKAFADIGVSRFVKQEHDSRIEHLVERIQATKIFYKGIELQRNYTEMDSELIEFIDIKGELNKDLINLSRGGFTQEGERYLETKLYPGLLDIAHKVLLHLEKEAKKDPENSFVKKIEKKVQAKYLHLIEENERNNTTEEFYQEKREFVSFIVSISILSYFACRDEWNLSEILHHRYEKRGEKWLDLIDSINDILKGGKINETKNKVEKISLELANMTNFFNLTVYSEIYTEALKHQVRYQENPGCCFAEIFSREYHWAIRQVRRDEYSDWKTQLIRLDRDSDSFYDKLVTVPQKTKEDNKLEEWAEKLCAAGNVINIQMDSSQQFIIKWLLKNVPAVGMFASHDGNIRVSILASRIYPSIYMNRAFRRLIVERMFKYAREGIERFSTIVWQGKEMLSFDKLPFSIFLVKRGYMPVYSYKKCIVPISGNKFVRWDSSQEKQELRELVLRVNRLLNEMDIGSALRELMQKSSDEKEYHLISEYCNASETDVIKEIENEIHEFIFSIPLEKKNLEKVSMEQLLEENPKRKKNWDDIYYKIALLYVSERTNRENSVESLQEIYDNSEVDSLYYAWMFAFVEGEEEIGNKYREKIYDNFLYVDEKDTMKEEKIISYIKKNGTYQNEEENIREGLYKFKEELTELIFEEELYPIRKTFKDFWRRSLIYYKRFKERYEHKEG